MQHSQDRDNHAPGGIQTPNPSKQAAADHAQDRMATICYSIHICFIIQWVPKQCKKILMWENMVQSQLQSDYSNLQLIFSPLWCLFKIFIFSQQPVTLERLGIPVLQHKLLPITSDKHPTQQHSPCITYISWWTQWSHSVRPLLFKVHSTIYFTQLSPFWDVNSCFTGEQHPAF
jgi:hypothetical protein